MMPWLRPGHRPSVAHARPRRHAPHLVVVPRSISRSTHFLHDQQQRVAFDRRMAFEAVSHIELQNALRVVAGMDHQALLLAIRRCRPRILDHRADRTPAAQDPALGPSRAGRTVENRPPATRR